MVIKSSSVQMESSRDYNRTSHREKAEAVVRSNVAASLELSAAGRKSAKTITDGSVTKLPSPEEAYRDASGRTLEEIKKRLGQDKDAKNENELQMRLNDAIMEEEAQLEKQKKAEDASQTRLLARQLGIDSVTENGNILGKQLKFIQTQDEFEAQLIKKLMEALRKMMYGDEDCEDEPRKDLSKIGEGFAWDLSASSAFSASAGFASVSPQGASAGSVQVSGMESVRFAGAVAQGGREIAIPGWTKITATSNFVKETETTHFRTQGVAFTADGRALNFGVDLEMSRAFEEHTLNFKQEAYKVIDPLVINLDSNAASVTDRKFFFDLDYDGHAEEISFAGNGSGFLALDKNGDGIINDGSELFGTRTGDGFKDLAVHDTDGIGWIDEADDVFDRLKIWTKNEDGTDRLMTLKEADVGAIYLGNASTQFSLHSDETGDKNAVIRKTGIYLKESSGAAGTMQHVDLVL